MIGGVGAAAHVTVVVVAIVVRAVVVVVIAVVSVSVTTVGTVTVMLMVEVDWRYSEQKRLAPADRVGFRRARRTLSALQPRRCQRSIEMSTACTRLTYRLIQYVIREDHASLGVHLG